MTRTLPFLLLLGASRLAVADTNVPIYVTIVMHAEENPYNASLFAYENVRTQIVPWAQTLYSNNVMFDFQPDWTLLEGTTNFDRLGAHAETAGTNIISWMKYTLGFEVDPHAHENTRSYADVAYLLTRCGILTQDLSHTVGGFVADPPTSSILDHVRYTITGYVNTAYTWTPEILWGGGTSSHVQETNNWSSGIWKPKSTNEFKVHDPAAPIPCVGNFGNTTQQWENLERLLAWRSAGLLCTNKMYTCNIMNNLRDLTHGYTTNFSAQLQAFKTNANLHWVTIGQAVQTWRTQYNEDPSILPFDWTLDVDNDGLDDGWEVTNNCDVTWTDGAGDYDGDAQDDAEECVAGTDPLDALDYFQVRDGVSWFSAVGRTYRVEMSTNLLGGWVTNYTAAGTGGVMNYTNEAAMGAAFYRVCVARP